MLVTPADMEAIYDEVLLVQATNYSDRAATAINLPMLQNACSVGSNIISGYLAGLGIAIERFRPSFRESLKIHSARLAMDFLAGSDPQIREQAKESTEWIKNISRLSKEGIENLIEAEAGTPEPIGEVLPSVSFESGRNWQVQL